MAVLIVDFLADGRCGVHAGQGSLSVDAPRSKAPVPDPGRPTGADFRCPIPYTSVDAGPVYLRVIVPSGAGKPDDSFPRLEWQQAGHDWIGIATLPSAPAFVSLGRPASPTAGTAFGWNFYGFFVFAAAFITVYFAWARWMQRRSAPTPR